MLHQAKVAPMLYSSSDDDRSDDFNRYCQGQTKNEASSTYMLVTPAQPSL
jgi:hypothetical protein